MIYRILFLIPGIIGVSLFAILFYLIMAVTP